MESSGEYPQPMEISGEDIYTRSKRESSVRDLDNYLLQQWYDGKPSKGNLKRWTIPDTHYTYREVEEPDYINYNLVRASIIPVVKINGVDNWVLGSFADYPANTYGVHGIYTDFGGSCKKKEHPFNCAFRELIEESKNLLTVPVYHALVETDVEKRKWKLYEGVNGNNKVFFYKVELDYNDVRKIPKFFNLLKTKEKLGPIGFYPESLVRNRTYRTTKNLTDFISYLNGYRF